MFNTLLETTGNADTTASVDWSAVLGTVWNTIVSWCLNTGIKIVIAMVILIVTFKIINSLSRRIEKRGEGGKFDKTVMRTIAYIFRIGLKVAVGICLVAYLGIDTSGLTALVASFGVCIGLAVNGALSNVAGGVLILVTRPFKIDDFIEAQGVSGTVEDIHMVCTKLRTPDNKVIYLPNGALSSGNIINYSEKDIRRVDFTFSIAYSADFNKAQRIITEIITSHELTLEEPEHMVRMSSHSASSIDIVARVWVNSADYWTVNFDVLEAVKAAFDENGIEIPFNQLDVHVKQD